MSLTQSFRYCQQAFSFQFIFIVEKYTPAKLNVFFLLLKIYISRRLNDAQTVKSQFRVHLARFQVQSTTTITCPTFNCNLSSVKKKEKLVCTYIYPYVYTFFNFHINLYVDYICAYRTRRMCFFKCLAIDPTQ